MTPSTKNEDEEPSLLVREYSVAGQPGRVVVLIISKPTRWGEDWVCHFRVEGIPDGHGFHPGVDPLQALQLAITSARMMLDASELPLVWMGGEPGDVGIPLPVPSTYGWKVQRKWERYLYRARLRRAYATAALIKLKMCRRAIRSRAKLTSRCCSA
jgi:hypothetical protein